MYIECFPRSEERVNAATHALGALLSVVGLVFLIDQAGTVGRSGSLPAVIVYGTALVLLFLFSALHHAVWRPRLKQFLLALDHCGIYLLIAGTYTPFCLLMPDGQGWALLAFVWSLALGGTTVQVCAFITGRSEHYEKYAFLFYLALGWIPMLIVADVIFTILQPMGLALLAAGGITYSAGVIFYLWRSLRFGHAIWHLFVVAGSTFHFFSIFYYVVPAAP